MKNTLFYTQLVEFKNYGHVYEIATTAGESCQLSKMGWERFEFSPCFISVSGT